MIDFILGNDKTSAIASGSTNCTRFEERRIYLVRHGQLDMQAYAKEGPSAGLTKLGQKQARKTAKRLGSVGSCSILCSPHGRARETAEIIANASPNAVLRPNRLLMELQSIGPPDDDTWRPAFKKSIQRGERAFSTFICPARQRQRVEIIVSHGNLIRYFVCRALGIAHESWLSLGTSHCAITHLRVTPDRITLVSYNETHHLPIHLHV